jgi:flagellar basal-body rod modification protein FlgD
MTTATFSAASGRNEFLQLLVTQLQNQDPLEPVGQTEFLQQLAQFSTLEGIEKLNASFAELLRAHELSEGLGLVGRHVRFTTGEGELVQEGRVEEATVQNGRVLLRIGEQEVAVEHIRSVLADPV